MQNARGQASILIAIIFQILFIFFAMVVNVGLLVHDKINLQNSVDIAAYYGAMKQAEVLNAMAQLNYQIRQSYKLLNWRIWAMGDVGRNPDFNQNNPNIDPPDHPGGWADGDNYPIVCVGNQFWTDSQTGSTTQNLCKASHITIPKILPIPPTFLQTVFVLPATILSAQIAAQADEFNGTFNGYAGKNFQMAARIYASYKIAAARRRFAIKQLQDYLIQSQNDFKDIDGQSVGATVVNTLKKNLSAANLGNNGSNIETITFLNGLGGHPFMVPIQVRVNAYYEQYDQTALNQLGYAVAMNTTPKTSPTSQGTDLYNTALPFFAVDYVSQYAKEKADDFRNETTSFQGNQNSYNSLVGFEKDPWVMAYVAVSAVTHPKMLFSPLAKDGKSQITLTAESFAMPFGGKMGPWYYKSWPQSEKSSVGSGASDKIDPLLPPPLDTPVQNGTVAIPPNYSRFPGDPDGMSSRRARAIANVGATLATYSALGEFDVDPLVAVVAGGSTVPPPTRILETQAIAPDAFDAAYYSVAYNYPDRFYLHTSNIEGLCRQFNNIPCWDLGSTLFPQAGPSSVQQVMTEVNTYASQHPNIMPQQPWKLREPEHLNTSWSQGDPGDYGVDEAVKVVGKKWSESETSGKPSGGRAGYSVKIVSKQFLKSPLPLGNDGNAAPIRNPPP